MAHHTVVSSYLEGSWALRLYWWACTCGAMDTGLTEHEATEAARQHNPDEAPTTEETPAP